MALPSGIPPGITGQWGTRTQDHLRRSRLTDVPGQMEVSGGTVFLGRRWRRRGAGGVAAVAESTTFPFQIYQHDPYVPVTDPITPLPISAWRTVRVRNGTVNNFMPKGDGAGSGFSCDGEPTVDPVEYSKRVSLVLPVSATSIIWIACSISTAIDANEGKIAAGEDFPVYVDFGASGWPRYPDEPNGSSSTGAPADAFYIKLGEVITGVDSPAQIDNPTPPPAKIANPLYHKLTLPLPQPRRTSLWVGMENFGPEINNDDGCFQQSRMYLRQA